MPLVSNHPSIALIGAGPRGASLIERIGAHLGRDRSRGERGGSLDLHVVDDAEIGAGRVWRTDQTRELCMNTLADAVTLFTEPSSTVEGPVVPGPTLYEWCLLAGAAVLPADDPRLAGIPPERSVRFDEAPVRPGFAEDFRDELAALRPESHPSRALYGEYIRWCFERACAALPENVRVVPRRARAVEVRRIGGRERVSLSDGGHLDADAVIAATGWLERTDSPGEQRLAEALAHRPELLRVRPGSPVEQDLSGVPAGADVIVRGLGMGFFDTMALLTVSRGGRFEPDPAAPGGLRYRPSGREPILHATSHRGVPFRAKSLYRSLPPRAEQRFLRKADWSAAPRPIDFDRTMWPRIVADAALDHYETLHRVRPQAFTAPLASVRREIEAALDTLLDPAVQRDLERRADQGDEQFSDGAGARGWLEAVPERIDDAVAELVPDRADRFDLLTEMDPAGGGFPDPEAYDAWVRARVADDLAEAELGRDSALKAGLWSIASARGFAGRVGSVGGFDAESRASGFALLHAVGGMAGSGPPAFRSRQLLALIDAGIVRFIGPEALVEVRDEGFFARSPRVDGSGITARVLIDAWMHFHDAGETADPLVGSLLAAGRARPFRIARRTGGSEATGGLDIEPATGLLVGADGSVDPAVHFAGIPVDATLHDTIISPMPGTDPTMLRETDRVARSALAVAFGDSGPRGAHHD